MKTRYDLMKESTTVDLKGNNYPDVLSLDLRNVKFENPLKTTEIVQNYVLRPYLLVYDEYDICYFDDLLYWLNGVSNVQELEVGEKMYIPNIIDLKKFYKDNLVTR